MSKIYEAVFKGDREAVEKLLKGGLLRRPADPNDRRPPLEYKMLGPVSTPLDVAVFCGHLEVVKVLLTNGADPNLVLMNSDGPLVNAILTLQPEMVRLLLENGADPRKQGMDVQTLSVAICDARRSPRVPIQTPLEQKYAAIAEIVDLLLQHGVSLEDYKTWSDGYAYQACALADAAAYGMAPVVQVLLAHGADVNGQDVTGFTALHGAAKAGRLDIAKRLIEAGADVGIKDRNGYTALTYAGKASDMIELLQSHGAK